MKNNNFLRGLVAATLLAATGVPLASRVSAAKITPAASRLILGVGGAQPDAAIDDFSLSSNGEWAVFASSATNLVADDTNGASDVFVMKMSTGKVARVSVSPDGSELAEDSTNPTICGNGQFVAFQTAADVDLLNDYNFGQDVYVTNRDADGNGRYDEFAKAGGVTQTLASIGSTGLTTSDGAGNPALSGNCAWVAFDTTDSLEDGDVNGISDIYVHSTNPADTVADADGLILSTANILISTGLNSDDGGGGYLPTLNDDGSLVAFYTRGLDLVQASSGRQGAILYNRDADGNNVLDESGNGKTSREYVSKNDGGTASAGDPDDSAPMSMTPDGSCIAFKFVTGNDLDTVSGITASSGVYLRNRTANTTRLMSFASIGGLPLSTSDAANPQVSSDCQFVAFDSGDSSLMSQDSNGKRDTFLHDVAAETTFEISRAADGSAGTGTSTAVAVGTATVDGTVPVYVLSDATSLLGAASGSSYTRPFRLDYNVRFPTAPRGLTAAVKTGTARQVGLSWTAPYGSETLSFAGYNALYRCGTRTSAAPCNGKWNTLGFVQVANPDLHTPTTAFTNQYFTLPAGVATKVVTVAVQGVLNDDDSTAGAFAVATVTPIDLPTLKAAALTLAAPAAATTTKPITVKIGSDAITALNGSTPSSYTVAYSLNGSTWTTVAPPAGGWKLNSSVKTVTGLKAKTKYFVRFTVATDAGSASVVQNITTK